MDGFVVTEEEKRSFYPKTASDPKPEKNCRVVPRNAHFTGSTSRENYLSHAKLKLFEESKTKVGYFNTQVFLGARVLILSKF